MNLNCNLEIVSFCDVTLGWAEVVRVGAGTLYRSCGQIGRVLQIHCNVVIYILVAYTRLCPGYNDMPTGKLWPSVT